MSREAVDELLNSQYAKYETIWKTLAEKYNCPIIQNNFEMPLFRLMGNRDAYDNGEKCRAPDPEPVPARVKSAKKAPSPKADSDAAPEASTKKEIDKQTDAGYIDLHDQLKALSEDQLQIVTAISRGETHIDDIIEATGMGAAKVLSQLTILEIKGYIRRVAGRRVSLNITQK